MSLFRDMKASTLQTQDQLMLLVVINFFIIKCYIIYIMINLINVYWLINFYSFDGETVYFFSCDKCSLKYWRRRLVTSCSYRTRQLSRSRSLLDIHRFLDPRGRSTRRCKLCLLISTPEFCSTSR